MLRLEGEKANQDLDMAYSEKEKELKRTAHDLDNSRNKNDRLLEDNSRLYMEVEKFKQHTGVLTEQNQKVNYYC